MNKLPLEIEKRMHPLCDLSITERIIEYVQEENLASIAEIASAVGSTTVTVTKHLTRLKDAGFLYERRVGKARVFYYKPGGGALNG